MAISQVCVTTCQAVSNSLLLDFAPVAVFTGILRGACLLISIFLSLSNVCHQAAREWRTRRGGRGGVGQHVRQLCALTLLSGSSVDAWRVACIVLGSTAHFQRSIPFFQVQAHSLPLWEDSIPRPRIETAARECLGHLQSPVSRARQLLPHACAWTSLHRDG